MDKTYIGVDFGTKKCGIAYTVGSFCFGYNTVSTNILIQVLQKIMQEKKPSKIIFGMPYNIDGTMSEHGKRIERYIEKIQREIDIPIETHDERLTSSEAKIGFSEAGVQGDIDMESARLILEGYLEKN